jgi:hypothetical protein
VGFIGGKTQTDIGAMDDLYLDGATFILLFAQKITNCCIPALGITDDVELLGLKGSKKKRSKKLDEDWTVRYTRLRSSAFLTIWHSAADPQANG